MEQATPMASTDTESVACERPARNWPWTLTAAPLASSEAAGWKGALLGCWRGTSAVMVQPPLEHHYLVMHLGGPKHVTRQHDGPAVSRAVDNGSLTLVPAGTAYTWRTQGPIAFAHLYLSRAHLETIVARDFDADGRGASLIEGVGLRDPLLERLLERMIGEIRCGPNPSKLLLDSLLESLGLRLAQKHVSGPPRGSAGAVALAPHRLRRVLEFMDANLGRDLCLAELVAAAGTSQFHFSHSFRLATGCSPYHYLMRRRIEYAKVLLLTGDDSLERISASCGFMRQHQFSTMFKRLCGVGPKRFRIDRTTSRLALASRTQVAISRPPEKTLSCE